MEASEAGHKELGKSRAGGGCRRKWPVWCLEEQGFSDISRDLVKMQIQIQ